MANNLPREAMVEESKYANGQLSEKGTVLTGADGIPIRIGRWQEWYENGHPSSEGDYVNGLKYGKWTFWYPNGQIREESTWSGVELDGPFTTWFSNGALKEDGTYRMGQKRGRWRNGLENGQPKDSGELVDGKQNGDWEIFFPDGSKRNGRFIDNRQDGVWTVVNKNGIKVEETEFVQGIQHGKHSLWSADGVPTETEEFLLGMEHGERARFDEHGNAVKREYYFVGRRLANKGEFDRLQPAIGNTRLKGTVSKGNSALFIAPFDGRATRVASVGETFLPVTKQSTFDGDHEVEEDPSQFVLIVQSTKLNAQLLSLHHAWDEAQAYKRKQSAVAGHLLAPLPLKLIGQDMALKTSLADVRALQLKWKASVDATQFTNDDLNFFNLIRWTRSDLHTATDKEIAQLTLSDWTLTLKARDVKDTVPAFPQTEPTARLNLRDRLEALRAKMDSSLLDPSFPDSIFYLNDTKNLGVFERQLFDERVAFNIKRNAILLSMLGTLPLHPYFANTKVVQKMAEQDERFFDGNLLPGETAESIQQNRLVLRAISALDFEDWLSSKQLAEQIDRSIEGIEQAYREAAELFDSGFAQVPFPAEVSGVNVIQGQPVAKGQPLVEVSHRFQRKITVLVPVDSAFSSLLQKDMKVSLRLNGSQLPPLTAGQIESFANEPFDDQDRTWRELRDRYHNGLKFGGTVTAKSISRDSPQFCQVEINLSVPEESWHVAVPSASELSLRLLLALPSELKDSVRFFKLSRSPLPENTTWEVSIEPAEETTVVEMKVQLQWWDLQRRLNQSSPGP